MYRLKLTEKAIDVNPAVAELEHEHGTVLEFDAKSDAEAFASRLSQSGDRVRVQAVAQNDPSEIDGYLIRWPERHIAEPKDSDKDGLTFDVGANQYGEVGKALVCGSYGLAPGVKYYFFEEFDHLTEERHKLQVKIEPHFPDAYEPRISWSPDCLIQVRSRPFWDLEERYFCEIKSGNASFERNQAEDMKTVAEEFGVLKIRVIIDNLPGEYTLRISEVEPNELD